MLQRKDQQTQALQTSQQHNPACPYCQRRFQTLDDLTLHIVTRHTQSGKARGPAQAGK